MPEFSDRKVLLGDGGIVPSSGAGDFLRDGGLRDCTPQRIASDAGFFERARDGGNVPCRDRTAGRIDPAATEED